jgi:hypothetical protein
MNRIIPFERLIPFVAALAVLGGTTTVLRAGQQAQQGQQQSALDLVEVVGCLTENPARTWVLTSATDPVVTKSIWTTKEALQDAGARPLANQRYRLLGVGPFGPEENKGKKVAVKGVLIKDAKETRLNVTSLQAVATSCAK